MMKTTTKALSYLRVSGASQVDGDGFPRQREAISRFCAQHCVEVVQEYRDEGVSGKLEMENREGLRELISRVRSNGIRLVVVENASRLARDLVVGELILAEFRKAECQVVAADSGTELTAGSGDPTSVLIRQVLGAVAQFEKSMVVVKLAAARARIRKSGQRCDGRKPFGFHPSERAALERMRSLRKSGVTLGRIAQFLDSEHYPSRTGKPWTKGAVAKILARGDAA